MNNPYEDLILYACNKAVAEWITGNMSFDEAIDYANSLCDQLADTDEFQVMLQNYINNFVDVKNIGDINNESN